MCSIAVIGCLSNKSICTPLSPLPQHTARLCFPAVLVSGVAIGLTSGHWNSAAWRYCTSRCGSEASPVLSLLSFVPPNGSHETGDDGTSRRKESRSLNYCLEKSPLLMMSICLTTWAQNKILVVLSHQLLMVSLSSSLIHSEFVKSEWFSVLSI